MQYYTYNIAQSNLRIPILQAVILVKDPKRTMKMLERRLDRRKMV